MKKEQMLGQLRAVLSALGSAIAVWGFTDPAGEDWQGAVGAILIAVSLVWGLVHHRDPGAPGRLSWSLLRKLVNVLGTMAVTYGFLHPEKVEVIGVIVASLGPLFASLWSWVDNSPDEP